MARCARRDCPSTPQTIEAVLEDHLIQRVLCHDLEAVADRLPAMPSLPAIRRLCDRLQIVAFSHFGRAEAVFLALPVAQRPGEAAMAALREMHRLDEIHAEDLVAALWAQARPGTRGNVEQLAYMLRCFFDGCRRAIALKESWIMGAGLSPVRSD